jgi:hypothetical protein
MITAIDGPAPWRAARQKEMAVGPLRSGDARVSLASGGAAPEIRLHEWIVAVVEH